MAREKVPSSSAGNTSGSTTETNPEIVKLLNEIRKEFPKAPDPSKVWTQACKNALKRELDKYNNSDESNPKIPRYFTEIGPLKYQNFLKHVLKHLRVIENTANSIYMDHERESCEKLYAEFMEPTDLKSAIERTMMSLTQFQHFSSDFNNTTNKSRRELLMEGSTELQAILKPSDEADEAQSEKERKEGYSLNNLWKDKWHPINLTMSFDMFQRIVNAFILQRKNPIKLFTQNKGHENTFKRHYLKYMYKCAESNQEFLLAVISFGTDVRFYPSKVMEFMQTRGLLKYEFNSFKPKNPLSAKGQTFSMSKDSVIPKRNAEFLKKFSPNPLARSSSSSSSSKTKPLIQIVKLVDLTEDVDVDNFNSNIEKEKNKDSKGKEDLKKRQGSTTSASTKSNGGGQNKSKRPQQPTKSNTTNTNSSGSKTQSSSLTSVRKLTYDPKPLNTEKGVVFAISEKVFRDCTRKLWQMFFEPGFNLSPTISSVWYRQYLTHIKTYKAQLNISVDKLLQDRQTSCHYDIPRLHSAIIEAVKADFTSLEMSRRSAGPFNMGTVEGIMYSQTSPLQLSLQDPTLNKSIPGPTGWSPTNCQLPYQVYEGHLEWKLGELGKSLDGLEIEMVKLRFVEYLSIVCSEAKQFILGVFTTYGPDLYLYPTRVIQLIKRKQLIRKGTKLDSIIQLPVDGRTYTALVPIKNPSNSRPGIEKGSFLGGPPPFASCVMPVQVPPQSFTQPHFQEIARMDPQFGAPQNFDPTLNLCPPWEQQGPMNDFSNGFEPAEFIHDRNYGDSYQNPPPPNYNHPEGAVFMDQNYPHPVPPPVNNAPYNSQPLKAVSTYPPKTSELPSVLPMDAWKAACERCLAKYGPKYGIGQLSSKDYQVLYDRYLFDTFDNPDDFVRGILTGISLARYPRDDEDPTTGLLQLPASSLPAAKAPLKPILKTHTPPKPPQEASKNNALSMNRDDLIRISSLIEKLIPNAAPAPVSSQSSAQLQLQVQEAVVSSPEYERPSRVQNQEPTPMAFDINEYRRPKVGAPPPATRRNYDEEDQGFEDHGQVIDYDHLRTSDRQRIANPSPMGAGFYRRPSGTFIGDNGPPLGSISNRMKRPAAAVDPYLDFYQNKRSYGGYD